MIFWWTQESWKAHIQILLESSIYRYIICDIPVNVNEQYLYSNASTPLHLIFILWLMLFLRLISISRLIKHRCSSVQYLWFLSKLLPFSSLFTEIVSFSMTMLTKPPTSSYISRDARNVQLWRKLITHSVHFSPHH